MTKLELDHLGKRFGEIAAVNDVSLAVEPGSLVALMGPSGCGKSTTLRMICGLESPSAGDIRFDGISVLDVPPHRRNIGMVFQRYVLFPHMRVADNIGFGLRMRKTPREEIAKRVSEVMQIVQLTGYERRFPNQLSGGEQQRVAIARTLITNPKLLLMDEPLSNLDTNLREEMRIFITGLQRRLHITMLFVTHDQTEAMELADKIGVMFKGHIVQVDRPERVFNRPLTPRIAEFMGATNLIKGRLTSSDGRRATFTLNGTEIAVERAPLQRQGEPIVATIRPEHIDILDGDGGRQTNVLRARILQRTYYGGIVGYRVAIGDLKLIIRERSGRIFEIDDEVPILLPPSRLWIFPHTT